MTLADNSAPTGKGIRVSGGTTTAKNTIITDNSSSGDNRAVDSAGTITSQGGNLEFPGTSCGFEIQADPKLALCKTTVVQPKPTRC